MFFVFINRLTTQKQRTIIKLLICRRFLNTLNYVIFVVSSPKIENTHNTYLYKTINRLKHFFYIFFISLQHNSKNTT